MGRLQSYYSCENVDYGIASGNTFPIPHCFEDYTSNNMSYTNNNINNGFEECSWFEQPTILKGISTSLCLVSIIVFFGYINFRNGGRRRISDNNSSSINM